MDDIHCVSIVIYFMGAILNMIIAVFTSSMFAKAASFACSLACIVFLLIEMGYLNGF